VASLDFWQKVKTQKKKKGLIKMKKLLALALTLCLIFTLTACGEKAADSEDNGAADTAKYPAGYTLHISDNLPDIEFKCDYNDYGDTLAEDFEGYSIDSAYVPVDSDESVIAVYRWNNEAGETLVEAAKHDIKLEENTEYVVPVEMDSWAEKGDYNYVYYTFYEEMEKGPAYIEDYYFNDGDDIVVIEWITYTEQIKVVDDVVFNMPKFMKQVEVSEEYAEVGVVASFADDSSGCYAGCDVYYLDKEANDINAVVDYYKENFDVKDSEVFTIENDIPMAWIQFSNTYEGTDYYVEDYVVDRGDKLMIIDFYTENDEWVPFMAASMTAMIYGFDKAEK